MSKILSRLGYDVVSGRNGIEGLTVHRENPCQFVLTDLDMPLMDGLTLARRIKTEYPLTPVVLMTGNALVERDTFHGAVRLFVDEVLYKPIRLVELRRTFRRLLP
jgi:CheY-like chemotaxis protein